MHKKILLPRADGALHSYAPVGDPLDVAPAAPSKSRVAYAAAHVVCDPLADNSPTLDADLDWEATLSTGDISGRSGSPSPRPWTRPSAGWDSGGRRAGS
jgi:Protein of unknown function (DUF993)